MHVDLRRREAHAFGGVHGVEHVVDQAADALVDLAHRLGDDVQAGIGVAKNGQMGHGTSSKRSRQTLVTAVDGTQRGAS